ncbi:hypothetical protein [Phenylobacterium sp.]|uniref:hypothetical protein n=1 Tax=Phenylobacterium sp. TaxID=1871053 RepID=UPI00286E77DD|nr:hypothetical protein [Phenylobacterium sp.]
MSALVERIIAARDSLKGLNISNYALIADARDVMADAANAITERDETIHALRNRLSKVEAFSSVELMNCARYVNEGRDSFEGATRGRELARLVLSVSAGE